MATQITADLPTLDFPREADYPTQEDWAAFSAAAELNFGILGNGWSTQMQLWKTQANLMSTELNTNATIAQGLANYKGDWISQGYTLGQTVSVSGVYYICKLTHASGQNPTAGGSIYWNLAIGNWNLKVNNYGDESITGIKSFSSKILAPNLAYKDTLVTINSWNYSGTTITLNVTSHTFIAGDYIETSGLTSTTNAPNGIYLVTSITTGTIVFTAYAAPTGTTGVSTASVKGIATLNGKIPISVGSIIETSGVAIGYGVGSGGTVTQLTSKATTVTLNKPTGQIITSNAAVAGNNGIAFSFNNSLLRVGDDILITINSLNYRVFANSIDTGGCTILIENRTAGSLSEVLVLNYKVLKGAIA